MWKDMLAALFNLGNSSALHVIPLTYAVHASGVCILHKVAITILSLTDPW